MDTVLNFFALKFIHDIDNYYAASVPKTSKLRKGIENPPVNTLTTDAWKNPGLEDEETKDGYNWKQKFLNIIYIILKFLYAGVYFYFMPFLCVAISWYAEK